MGALATPTRPGLSAPRRLLRLRSDTALAERFAAGDEDAFAVLYERHRAIVLAVCMGVLGRRHDAEDALQETFVSLARTLRSEPPRELRPWLARVARNAAIDMARRRRPVDCAGDDLPDRPVPADTTPGEFQSVLEGIRELPENQRTALLMRELAGHTYREIATFLETEEEAVRGLIARARIGLRDHRAASELTCDVAQEVLALVPDRRPGDRTIRRHVRGCSSCQAYVRMLRDDARVLRGLAPISGGGVVAGGALLGGLGAKGALLGGALTPLGTACAVSCAVGGIALIAPQLPAQHHRGSGAHRGAVAPPARGAGGTTSVSVSASASGSSGASAAWGVRVPGTSGGVSGTGSAGATSFVKTPSVAGAGRRADRSLSPVGSAGSGGNRSLAARGSQGRSVGEPGHGYTSQPQPSGPPNGAGGGSDQRSQSQPQPQPGSSDGHPQPASPGGAPRYVRVDRGVAPVVKTTERSEPAGGAPVPLAAGIAVGQGSDRPVRG